MTLVMGNLVIPSVRKIKKKTLPLFFILKPELDNLKIFMHGEMKTIL